MFLWGEDDHDDGTGNDNDLILIIISQVDDMTV